MFPIFNPCLFSWKLDIFLSFVRYGYINIFSHLQLLFYCTYSLLGFSKFHKLKHFTMVCCEIGFSLPSINDNQLVPFIFVTSGSGKPNSNMQLATTEFTEFWKMQYLNKMEWHVWLCYFIASHLFPSLPTPPTTLVPPHALPFHQRHHDSGYYWLMIYSFPGLAQHLLQRVKSMEETF